MQISATAEGEDDAVILRVKWDVKLDNSVISQAKAAASGGRVEQVTERSLVDAGGNEYRSNSRIDMRWHYENTPQSFGEKFYVVPDCGHHDAILSRHVPPPRDPPAASTPVLNRPDRRKEKEEQKRREAEASKRREHEVRHEEARIREDIAAWKRGDRSA